MFENLTAAPADKILGLSTLCDLIVAYTFTRPSVLLLAQTHWMARRKVMGIEATTTAGGDR